jgi:hypothetical protein
LDKSSDLIKPNNNLRYADFHGFEASLKKVFLHRLDTFFQKETWVRTKAGLTLRTFKQLDLSKMNKQQIIFKNIINQPTTLKLFLHNQEHTSSTNFSLALSLRIANRDI